MDKVWQSVNLAYVWGLKDEALYTVTIVQWTQIGLFHLLIVAEGLMYQE